MEFNPLFNPTPSPNWAKPSTHAVIRSQFRIETWMLLGAIGQSMLTIFLPLRLAFLPAAVFILAKIVSVFAMRAGVLRNPAMDDVIMPKHSSQAPDSTGSFGNKPARDSMAVFFLGARSNSPLGLFEPKFKEIGDWLDKMDKQIRADPDKYGFLGSTLWQSSGEDSNPTLLNIMYFKSAAHVHEYAHGPIHRDAWNWWYKNLDSLKGIGIMHELYDVPSGSYESVYVQFAPLLAGLNRHKITTKSDKGESKVEWQSPLVMATKGALRTSKGRMSRSNGTENEKYGHDEV